MFPWCAHRNAAVLFFDMPVVPSGLTGAQTLRHHSDYTFLFTVARDPLLAATTTNLSFFSVQAIQESEVDLTPHQVLVRFTF